MRNVIPGLLLFSLIGLSGCSRDDVAVYDIPKEAPPAQPMPGSGSGTDPHAGMAMSQPAVQWGELPEGWSVGAQGSGMRLATFTIAGDGEESAEMAIIPMGGFAGTDEQLVNMWRMQLGLSELAQAEAGDQGEAIKVGGIDGKIYEMTGVANGIDTRILVASVNKDGVNYFFKLIGHDQLVTAEKPVFLAFLDEVTFAPAAPVATAAAPPEAAPAMSSSDARWEAPAGWEELPPTQFLLAKYQVPAEGGAGAQVTVSMLGGGAGGLLPNVNRWRGQMKLGPVDEAGLKALTTSMQAGSAEATLVTLEGTDAQTGSPGKMLAVVVPLPSETWFFKMTGPAAVVDAKAGEFEAFVKAARF